MKMPFKRQLFALFAAGAALVASPASAQPAQIDMVVFGPPSLGAFLTPIIKSGKFDTKNDISLNFIERPPGAYIAGFNSGEFKVGGSAALLSVAIASNKGVKVSYLFNLFDYFGAVVTDRPEIQTVKDLEGKQLVAATATTNFAMFRWLAMNKGVDLSTIDLQNTAPPGLVGYALADRADAVQLWEPAYSILLSKKPGLRTLDLGMAQSWSKFAGTETIPYLGVAAHDDWIQKNPELVNKLYATYKDAADWLTANPAEGAGIIAASIKGADESVIKALISTSGRLGLNVQSAGALKQSIEAVYAAGRQSGYLDKDVAASTIYTGIKP